MPFVLIHFTLACFLGVVGNSLLSRLFGCIILKSWYHKSLIINFKRVETLISIHCASRPFMATGSLGGICYSFPNKYKYQSLKDVLVSFLSGQNVF